MGNEKVSIIIPIYKVERYLPGCIESVIGQTYRNLEILLVDDGSPDNCPEICDLYAAKDERIRVFHLKNGGVAAARNFALDRATGDYLAFIDGDDLAAPDYIEYLYHLLKVTGADIALCGHQNIPEEELENVTFGGRTDNPHDDGEIVAYTTQEALRALLYQIPFDAAPWSKLFRREVFGDIRFPVGCCYEDFAIMPRVFDRAKRLCYHPYAGYGYVLRGAGMTLRAFSEQKMQLIDVAQENEAFVLANYPQLRDAVYSRVVRANLHIYSQIPLFTHKAFRRRIAGVVRKRRATVLCDRNARRGTKLALLMTYAGFFPIRLLQRFKFLAKK